LFVILFLDYHICKRLVQFLCSFPFKSQTVEARWGIYFTDVENAVHDMSASFWQWNNSSVLVSGMQVARVTANSIKNRSRPP